MSGFEDKLSAILGDENAMGQIMALAQSLSVPEGGSGEASPLPDGDGEEDIRLLTALRPYLKQGRQKKLDRMLELLRLLRLLRGGRE